MKKVYLIVLFMVALCVCSCGSEPAAVVSSMEPTQEPVAAATPEPTQEPVTVTISTPEPIVTQSEPMILTQPDDYQPNACYTSVTVGDSTIYSFTDTQGQVQSRVYAGYYIYHDGDIFDTACGLYPAMTGEDGQVELIKGEASVDIDSEPLGQCVPCQVEEGVRTDKSFVKMEQVGLYKYGDEYIVYGSFENMEPAFYPAHENGQMIAGALAFEGDVVIPSYYPEDEPEQDGKMLLIVYINTQSVVAYKAENGQWVEQRAMICSTGRSDKYYPTPRGTYRIPEIYRYKKLGLKEGDYWYGQYASRITTNYLFHSTPIWEAAGRDVDVGKTMVKLSQYEMLGQPASGGCVRLAVIDAKWIYDNCGVKTEVRIGDWDGPIVGKPPAIIYEEPYMTGQDMGWDPTDPDPDNPYHAIYGIMD